MKKNKLFILSILVLITSCSPTIYNVGTWVNKEKLGKGKYDNIYILSMMQNNVTNTIIEGDFSDALNKRKIKNTKNTNVYTSTFSGGQTGKDEILAKAKELGCNAIVTIGLLDVKTESYYVPGTTSYYEPYPTYGYYNQFPGYYSTYYNTTTTPGYYVDDKVYFVECNLFDVNTQEILFSIQSKTYNPTDVQKISRLYTADIVKTLQKEGVLKLE